RRAVRDEMDHGLFKRQYVWVVLLASDLQLELHSRMPLSQFGNEALRLFTGHIAAAIDRHQLGCRGSARQDTFDDGEVRVADLHDVVVHDGDDVARFDLAMVGRAVAHRSRYLDTT